MIAERRHELDRHEFGLPGCTPEAASFATGNKTRGWRLRGPPVSSPLRRGRDLRRRTFVGNEVGLIMQQAADAGVQALTWTGRTGQAWVTIKNGVIRTGVNRRGHVR